jgi:hypothetical protein
MATKRTTVGGHDSGKGSNFVTRANPFGKVTTLHGAPELASATMAPKAIDTALRAGCAVMFGWTRDQGALCITILDGQDRHRTYCSNETELDDALTSMLEMYAND